MKETLPTILQDWITQFENEKNPKIKYNFYRQLLNCQEEIQKATKNYNENVKV